MISSEKNNHPYFSQPYKKYARYREGKGLAICKRGLYRQAGSTKTLVLICLLILWLPLSGRGCPPGKDFGLRV